MCNMKVRYLILFVLVALISSCNDAKKSNVYQIGFSQCSEDDWRRSMNLEILREATFYDDLNIEIRSANDNNQKQIDDINYFINKGVDLLIVSPNSAAPLTEVVEKAMKAGIPVVLTDRKINSENYTAYVGANNYQIGKEVALYVSDILSGKGKVLEMRGLNGSTPDYERHTGFLSALSQYPNLKLIKYVHGDWNRSTAKLKMSQLLEQNLDMDLIFAQNDEMAIGVYEAIKERGKLNKRYLIVGIDALSGPEGGIQQVINGNLDATFIYPTGGDKVVQTARKILRKEHYERINQLYTGLVDKSNARTIKLQTDQIIYHQNRINDLNKVLNKNLAQYSEQRIILFVSLFIIVVFILLVISLFRSDRHKNKINKELEETNKEINKQKEELSEQKDQLVVLSKNLEEATQAKLVFFTNISHEFRTPLSLLLGPIEALSKTEKVSTERKRLFMMMKRNVYVLMKLIDQIIDFRKYENGKMKMIYTLGDYRSFLKSNCDSFSSLVKKKHQHLKFYSSDDDFTLWFDSDKIQKITYNLISNAIKYTPENGTIEVILSKVVRNEEAFAKVDVRDNGPGISQEHIHKIFDRYYRINENDQSGSGIGLALTKILVEQHLGSITVNSTPGEGACFEFEIPFKQKDISLEDQYPVLDSKSIDPDDHMILYDMELDDLPVENSISEVALKPSLLVVEDNDDLRHYIKSLFKEEYNIIEASNGQSGYFQALKNIPDLIISDVLMEGMDGYMLCKTLKENLTTSHIPIILLTALSMDEQKAKGFESGADAYIPKPFNEGILQIRVRKLLENRSMLKSHFQENLTFGDEKEKITPIDKSFMDKFRKIVEDNIMDAELNVDEIGRLLGLSRVQLYRKIKSLTNYAPSDLIRNIRLKAAKQLFIQSEKSISEVAYDTGFTSPSYFTKCFKEYFSESPTEFLKRVK